VRPHIPRRLEDVDNGKILGFGADLSEDHPGYHDDAYKQRRVDIANSARAHEVGQPIPYLEYTPEEVQCWGTVLRKLKKLHAKHACKEYLRSYPEFDFREDVVPQLEDLSQILKQTTGWQIRPVAGLLHPRDFLNGLAFKTFHSTQYMRHHSKPMYTPEPDLCHELLGHVPMLADPAFCDLAYAIGLASLGADEKQIWHLTKIYWFTVEFGVVKEDNEMKAFGAGILSSYGELENMASGKPAFEPFDPFAPQPKMSYKDGYQKRYFVLESFEDGAAKLRKYCDSIIDSEVLAEWRAHQ
jgi:phenylalanine-4-hydroxylase